MSFSIVIASYGGKRWKALGDNRALSSANIQGAEEVLRVHQEQGTVASARNEAARMAIGEWLIFLDADDALAPGYVDAMRQASEQQTSDKSRLLLTPAVRYLGQRRRARDPFFHPECDLWSGNWIVIGTAVQRELFMEVGGFDDRADYGAFEDWALWIKCWKADAQIIKVPEAIYVAHVSPHSRHRGAQQHTRLGWHYAIGRDHFPEHYPENWMRRRGVRA
jgi:glycosyltransferase involved in cell wall biosynthesis